jgi:hypothetical protein
MPLPPNIPTRPAPAQPNLPLQTTQLKLSDLQEPGLSTLNNLFSSIQNQITSLIGANGPTPLPSGANMGGAPVQNIGEPQSPADAISKAHAEANYSATALAPQLEAGQNTGLKTYRALNSKQQQESYSNFLEGVLNTAPTANTSTITGTTSGGSAVVSVSAGSHLFVSGNQNSYVQRTDTISLVSGMGVYYYYLSKGSQTLAISQPYAADTQANRTQANQDGTVIVGVATIDGSGLVTNQSAAGATTPATTGNFRLLTRL